jgi:hypothetical protein
MMVRGHPGVLQRYRTPGTLFRIGFIGGLLSQIVPQETEKTQRDWRGTRCGMAFLRITSFGILYLRAICPRGSIAV